MRPESAQSESRHVASAPVTVRRVAAHAHGTDGIQRAAGGRGRESVCAGCVARERARARESGSSRRRNKTNRTQYAISLANIRYIFRGMYTHNHTPHMPMHTAPSPCAEVRGGPIRSTSHVGGRRRDRTTPTQHTAHQHTAHGALATDIRVPPQVSPDHSLMSFRRPLAPALARTALSGQQ